MHCCWSLCMPKTNFGLKYSKPVNTVSGYPHEYALCNVEMGLASLPCDPDWDMTAYSTGWCSLYAVEQLGQTFCGFTSKQQHILQLCSGPASVRLSCVLTEKPLSYHPASKYLNGSPAKTTLPRQPCKQYHSVTVGGEGTMAHHVTRCNHHYETKHLDEMAISTLMITACVKAQITEWVNLVTQLRRHSVYILHNLGYLVIND